MLLAEGSPDPLFGRWIATYGGEEYGETVERVLEEMDPTAFRCTVADESVSGTLEEIGGESYEREEVDALRETIRDEIEAEQDAEV